MAADIETGTLVAPSNDKGVCETPHAVTPHASKTEDLHTDTDSFIPYFSVLCPVNRELDYLILNEAKATEKQKILYINS